MREVVELRWTLGWLLAILCAVSAWAQKPVTVNSEELSQHVVKRVPVVPPAKAKAGDMNGTVVLLVHVSAAGKVTSAQALSGRASLQAAARKSVEQWVYEPFKKDGKAVAVVGLVRVNFDGSGGPQSKVEKYLAEVRAKYATEPKLAAAGFSCRVEPEWREFPGLQHVAADSPLMRGLKRTRVRLLVPTAGAPLTQVDKPKKPKLNVKDLAEADEVVTATRRMVEGFYETWLPFGILGPRAPASATMKKLPGKTVIEFKQGGMTDWMSIDGTARMLHFTELMQNGEAVEESPHFGASQDGLLYTGTDFVIHRGRTNTHGAYRIAYRQVDGFRMPKTVEIEVKGSLDVHFRFTGCKVGGK